MQQKRKHNWDVKLREEAATGNVEAVAKLARRRERSRIHGINYRERQRAKALAADVSATMQAGHGKTTVMVSPPLSDRNQAVDPVRCAAQANKPTTGHKSASKHDRHLCSNDDDDSRNEDDDNDDSEDGGEDDDSEDDGSENGDEDQNGIQDRERSVKQETDARPSTMIATSHIDGEDLHYLELELQHEEAEQERCEAKQKACEALQRALRIRMKLHRARRGKA